MPRPLLIFALMLAGCSDLGHRQDPGNASGRSTSIAWGASDIIAARPQLIWSSDRRYKLTIDGGDPKQTVLLDAPFEKPVRKIEAPASAAWHPSLPIFFINDGQGSGQFSEPSTYRITREKFEEIKIADIARNAFIEKSGCRIAKDNISLFATGWSRHSDSLILFVEAWDRDNYCDTSEASFIKLKLTGPAVEKIYSLAEAKATFCEDPAFLRQRFAVCAP